MNQKFVSPLHKKWKDFCEYTSIHGLIYIYAKPTLSKATRLIWKIIWLTFFALCIYQSMLNVLQYFSYHEKVTTTYETEPSAEFPSITFSPMSLVKRSAVGAYTPMYSILASWLAEREIEIDPLSKEISKTCYWNISSELTKLLQSYGFGDGIVHEMGPINFSRILVLDFFSMLVKCSWRDKEFNCSDAFMEHVSDGLSSFTFNIGNHLVDLQTTTSDNNSQMTSGYGLERDHYHESDYVVHAPNQGLKLFVNIHQNESCDHDKLKRGAGLTFQIHDTNTFSSLFIDPTYHLSPGYHFNVGISRTKYQRNIEHLGHCSSLNKDLYLFPYLKGMNVQRFCYVQCMAEIILKKCRCYPLHLVAFDKIFRQHAERYSMLAGDVKSCHTIQQIICVAQKTKNTLFEQSWNTLCPYCKQQCVEGKYELKISKSFLSKNVVDRFISGSASDEEIRKNYLSVHFYYSSMNVLLIEESQQFTCKDMFIYIGGNIGLFLGMSFISPFEVVDIVLEIMYGFWKMSRSVGPPIRVHRRRCRKQLQEIPMDTIKTVVVSPATPENLNSRQST